MVDGRSCRTYMENRSVWTGNVANRLVEGERIWRQRRRGSDEGNLKIEAISGMKWTKSIWGCNPYLFPGCSCQRALRCGR